MKQAKRVSLTSLNLGQNKKAVEDFVRGGQMAGRQDGDEEVAEWQDGDGRTARRQDGTAADHHAAGGHVGLKKTTLRLDRDVYLELKRRHAEATAVNEKTTMGEIVSNVLRGAWALAEGGAPGEIRVAS